MVSAKAQVDTYILAGQSNMCGAGAPDGMGVQNQGRVWMFNPAGKWDALSDPVEPCITNWQPRITGVGPGLTFADRMASLYPGHDIGVIQCAVGGAYMAPQVNDASGKPTNVPYWEPAMSTASLYGRMIQMVQKAIKAGGIIRGFLWYQGESESLNRADVVYYDTRMRALFAAVRQDLGISNLPIVFVQIGPDPHWPGWEYWADVQSWQQAIADAGWPNVAMVTAADLQSLSGGQANHLNTASQRTLGVRLANAMYQLQNP